jgi:DNA-binding NarL/FixJ family response regulator
MKWLPRVVVADDHDGLRSEIAETLRSNVEVVACVGDGHSAIQACQEHQPDLLVIDVSMPGIGGFEAARAAKAHTPALKILFVTSHGSPAYVDAARELGASGYLLEALAGDPHAGCSYRHLEWRRVLARWPRRRQLDWLAA